MRRLAAGVLASLLACLLAFPLPSGAAINPGKVAVYDSTLATAVTLTGTSLNTNVTNTVTVSGSGTFTVAGTVTANAGTGILSTNIGQVGGNTVVTGGATGSLGVGGLGASGATKVGNPILQGGVFNTTQPTVTTGQAVDQQMTARGAAIVAPGTEGFSVTANAGTNLNTSALLLEATVGRAQGSTTSGQTGPIIQGAVTTSAPAYTTGQTSPFSLQTDGSLRTAVMAGPLDRTASGNIAGAGQAVQIALTGLQGASYTLLGTWTAGLRAQYSSDGGTTWTDIDSYAPAVEALQLDVTGNGQYIFHIVGGASHVRVTANSFTSGTANVTLRATQAPIGMLPSFDRPVGQSPPNHVAYTGGTDGTNIQPFRLFDVDTGAGSQFLQGVSLRKAASGGSVEAGTSTDPLRTDPTGTTAQPVTNATASNFNAQVQGAGASGAAKAGNPVQIGGVFNTTQPTVTTGQGVEAQMTARGGAIVAVGVDGFAVSQGGTWSVRLQDGSGNLINSTTNSLHVNCSNCSGSGVNQTDTTTFTPAASSFASGGGFFQTTATNNALTNLQMGAFQVTANRALFVNPRNAAGTEIGTATNPFRVDTTGTTTQPVSGTITANAGTGTFTVDSELAAAAALADGAANPTTATVGGATLIWNGTTWDRVKGAANALNSTGTGIPTAQLVGQFDDASPTAITENQFGNLRTSANRNLYGTIRDAAGNERGANVTATNALVVDGSAVTQPVSGTLTIGTFPDNEPFNLAQVAGTATSVNAGTASAGTIRVVQASDQTVPLVIDTGASVHYRTSAGATEDEHEIKATAGRLFSVTVTNTNAAARYLRCYNLTAANTTPGTSTVFFGLAIPGATTGAGFTVPFPNGGIAFSVALTCAFTTGAADTDVAEVAANEIKAVYSFK